jgi:hypothetical protein
VNEFSWSIWKTGRRWLSRRLPFFVFFFCYYVSYKFKIPLTAGMVTNAGALFRVGSTLPCFPSHLAMAPLADFILKYVPLPQIPYHYTHYVRGATPLSTQPVVLSMLAGYLAAIFGIREIMKTRQPQKLTFLFQVHNAILSSGSALLLVLMLEEILPIYWRHGVFYALCNAGAWTEVSKLSFSEFWERTELSACSVWNYIISSITISNTSNCLTRFSSH